MTATLPALTHIHLSVDDDGVATALIDRAGETVNTLTVEVMTDLREVVSTVEEDPGIKAVVIGSAKERSFVAGADIAWLATLDDTAVAVGLLAEAHAVFRRIEALHTTGGKPVVAAIDGPALGGGCELALACGVRICSDDEATTQLGLPEVKLGILPAAGGTQRLPRLVGVATALDLMLTGRSVRPRSALKMGLVDEICPREVLLDVARRRAREARETAPAPGSIDRVRSWLAPSHLQRLALEETPPGRRLLFSKAEEAMLEETRGNYPAPQEILAAVRTGIDHGSEAGYAAELAAFGRLVVSPEAKELIRIFLAGQELKHDPGVATDVAPRPVAKLGVVGGGLMGGGIASVSALTAGVRTRIKEVDDAGVRRGLAHVERNVAEAQKRRRLTEGKAARVRSLVTGTTDLRGFHDVDLVIEAVFEDLELKRSVLRDFEAVAPPQAIFASNTSSIPIADIAAASSRPETVIGMHYFSPVEKMPLLEVVVTDRTADWVTATCVAFGKRQGKTVIVVNDGPGFYTTRVLGPFSVEVMHLLGEGVPVEDIDAAITAWGFPVGPVTLIDEVGIDVGAKITGILHGAFGDRISVPPSFDRLVADDRRGRKNGRGFYSYEDGKKGGVDTSVYEVLGVRPTTRLERSEIQDRIVLPFVNEAVRCLDEGVLRSARDGDIGAVFGLGFPPFRGGPFAYVDHVGAAAVVARLEELASRHGARFAPADPLRAHAESGEPFRLS